MASLLPEDPQAIEAGMRGRCLLGSLLTLLSVTSPPDACMRLQLNSLVTNEEDARVKKEEKRGQRAGAGTREGCCS